MYPELQQVYWHSGIFLQPQHLQSTDLYHNYMLSRHNQLSQPWNIGIIDCEFNTETLVNFSIKIESLKALMPSGEYLEYPGNCSLQPRLFRDVWIQREKPLTLWLALRRFDPSHVNVGNTSNSRWVIPGEGKMMKDVYLDGPECSVARVIYNVQILSDEEKGTAVDCEFLPLLRLLYDNERVIIDGHFCPPSLTLRGSSVLWSLVDGLYAELASRAYQFEEFKRSEHVHNKGHDFVTQLQVMRSLNRTLALLHHYCQTPNMHPWSVYGLLIQLVGELSVFNESCSFNGRWTEGEKSLLYYDHFNLFSTFTNVRESLIMLLNGLTLEDNHWISLSPDEQGICRGDLQTIPEKEYTVLLLLRSDTIATTRLPDSSEFKIAASEDITTLIQHALPGVPLSKLSPVPRGVPNRKDAFCFLIDQRSNLWKKIETLKNIAFYWDNAPADLQIHLIFKGATHAI